MHYRLFVTFTHDHASNSEQARHYAYDTLLAEGFTESDGLFNEAPSDWFVIGGRWSGELLTGNNTAFYDKSKELIGESDQFISQDGTKAHAKELNQYWAELGGQDEHPWLRDNYDHWGYEDDAQILTPETYELIRKYEGDWTHEEGEWSHLVYVDLDQDELNNEFIGKKWIVVVDYHN